MLMLSRLACFSPHHSSRTEFIEGLTKLMVNGSIFSVLKTITESIINIIYPPICVGCNKPMHHTKNNIFLCSQCYYNIKRHTPPFCQKCGRGLIEAENIIKGICPTCIDRRYHFQRAYSICSYEGTIKELIHKFKYSQKLHYKIIFEKLCSEFIDAFKILSDIDIIIPIPLHSARLREREYNQSQILSSILSNIINKPVVSNLLMRVRNTKPQVALDEKSRIENICGCFSVKNNQMLKSRNILLVDDVLTTGITLSEAAKSIKEFKPNNIFAFAMAS